MPSWKHGCFLAEWMWTSLCFLLACSSDFCRLKRKSNEGQRKVFGFWTLVHKRESLLQLISYYFHFFRSRRNMKAKQSSQVFLTSFCTVSSEDNLDQFSQPRYLFSAMKRFGSSSTCFNSLLYKSSCCILLLAAWLSARGSVFEQCWKHCCGFHL